MNKRYLPIIAAVLIAITCTAFLPAFAQQQLGSNGLPVLPTMIFAAPTLTVVTIPQDDQARHTGIIWFAETKADFLLMQAASPTFSGVQDLIAQFKILVSYNGVPVSATIYCQAVEKDKYEPLKNKQGAWETLASWPKDVSQDIVCKPRWGKPGVGVLDVYWVAAPSAYNIADFELVVSASYAVGRSTVWGTEMQDFCVLGWPAAVTDGTPGPLEAELAAFNAAPYVITKPDGTTHWILTDPLGGWASCEDLALVQKQELGVPIAWQ